MRRACVMMIAAWLGAPLAIAGDPPAEKAPNAQQLRMKECNQRAGERKGEERKQFMSTCLSGKETEPKMTQQERMKICNQRAGERKGEERKQFMSQCLKG